MIAALATSTAGTAAPAEAAGSAVSSGPDFDADGLADLAVSAIGEDVDGESGAGTVTVLYGTPDGVGTERAQR